MSEDNVYKFPIFSDGENRFVFRYFFYGGPDQLIYDWSKANKIRLALSLTEEKDPLVLVLDDEGCFNFSHVSATATAPGLFVPADVWILSGPKFDDADAKTE